MSCNFFVAQVASTYLCQKIILLNATGLYMPTGIISARYAVAHDTVFCGHPVNISVYYHPQHSANISSFMAAYKDGLRYYSSVYGNYPFNDMKLAETPVYGPREASMATLDSYAEYNSWNADLTNVNQFDYLYFAATRDLARQWWGSR